MPEFGFTITEHDPGRPWIVTGREHQTVRLDAGISFFDWASRALAGAPLECAA